MTSMLTAFLYIPYVPESIFWRPYLCEMGSGTLLDSFIEGFRVRNPGTDLRVLVHTEDVNPTLDAIVERTGVTRVSTEYKTRSQAFLEASIDCHSPHVAFVSLEHGFTPPDFLARAFAHHLQHDNAFTPVLGFPSDCTPEVYDSTFLKALRECPLPSGAGNLMTLAQQVMSVLEKGPPASLPMGQYEALRRVADALRVAGQGSVKATPFDAAAEYMAHPRELPESLRIRNSTHVEIARAVIQSRSQLTDPLGDLHSWKKEMLRQQRALGNESRRYGVRRAARARTPHTKVLFVSTPSAYSGAEESLCQLVGELGRQQYSTHALVGACGYFTERLREFGASVIAPNRDFSSNSVENFFFSLDTLRRIKPDLVHINAESGIPIIVAARLLDIPVVYHLRVAALQKIADYLKASDAIIAVSKFIQGEVERRDIDSTRIEVIFDGVDTDHFSAAHFSKAIVRRELGLPADSPIALNIARFARNKRHDLLVAASELVRKKLPDYHLVLVGEAEDQRYYSEIVEQIERAGLACNVTFLPFQRDIRKIEAASDVLVLCSDREPLGTCLLEAMAMELPVVVTTSGGSHELFVDGETGLKTRGGDVHELAAAIESILTSPELAHRLKKAARHQAETEFTIQNHARAVISLYEQVLQRSGSTDTAAPRTGVTPRIPPYAVVVQHDNR